MSEKNERKRRQRGHGTIERLPSGKYRVRVPDGAGGRKTLGPVDTPEEAEQLLLAGRELLAQKKVRPVGGLTVDSYGQQWMDDIEREGRRSMAGVRSGWRHIEKSDLARLPLKEVTRGMVRQLERRLERAKLGAAYRRQIVGFLRQCFDAAEREGLVETNPVPPIKRQSKASKARESQKAWTYLTLEEQAAIWRCEEIPLGARLAIFFLLATGLRKGEWIHLHDADVDLAEGREKIIVRYGSRGQLPKNGKIRELPLNHVAIGVLRAWYELRPTLVSENPQGLAFPTENGCERDAGRPFGKWVDGKSTRSLFAYYMRLAGITRRVRIHDLRHTCAAILVSGMWGKPWPLIRVRDYLGHSTIKQTELYAHLAPSALVEEARATGGDQSTISPRPAEAGSGSPASPIAPALFQFGQSRPSRASSGHPGSSTAGAGTSLAGSSR